MESNDANQLPLLFPERDNTDLFPNPWPNRDLPARKHRTPKRDSDQWKAVMRFRNSRYWNKRGDLQKFADYFGVDQSALSRKIKDSQIQWIPAAAEGAGSSQGDSTPPRVRRPPRPHPPSLLPSEPRRRRLTLGAETLAQARSPRQRRRRPPAPRPPRIQRSILRQVRRSPPAPEPKSLII